ncbi:MAG: hypothetical protein KatS3mg051_0194 [Anaerolineae bacterium]|nr:MAG: hypothetical protein KatS3mg051_0194 [Anaerolineae bacterium]
MLQTLVARPDLGYKVVGFVDDDPERGANDLGRVPALGGLDNLPRLIDTHKVDLVIITLPWHVQRKILNIVRECERKHVKVRTVPDLFELSLSQVQVEMLGGIPLLGLNGEARFSPSNRIAKRVLDLILVLIALPPALLITAITALAIRLDSPGPIFFTQERIGLNGKPFKVYKFRSMVVDAEKMHADLIRQTGEDPPPSQAGQRSARDARRALDSPLQHRRSAANLEHPARRNELGGAASGSAAGGGAL